MSRVETMRHSDPGYMSLDNQKEFYYIVLGNKDKPEFKVTRWGTKGAITHHACDIDFLYTVWLNNNELCSVYQSNCHRGGKVNFYLLGINGGIYDTLESDFYCGIEICETIVKRWAEDERIRKEMERKVANQKHQNFLSSFSKAGRH